MAPNRSIGIAMHRPFSQHRLGLAKATAALGYGTATPQPGPRVTGAPAHPQVCPDPNPTYPPPSTIYRNLAGLTATQPLVNRLQQTGSNSPGPAHPPSQQGSPYPTLPLQLVSSHSFKTVIFKKLANQTVSCFSNSTRASQSYQPSPHPNLSTKQFWRAMWQSIWLINHPHHSTCLLEHWIVLMNEISSISPMVIFSFLLKLEIWKNRISIRETIKCDIALAFHT
jgi:hypothetical protein